MPHEADESLTTAAAAAAAQRDAVEKDSQLSRVEIAELSDFAKGKDKIEAQIRVSRRAAQWACDAS